MQVFAEIQCLTERSAALKGVDLLKNHFKGGDKRALSELLQRFISYNSEQFSFLGVEPILEGAGLTSRLIFKSSSYIGAVPLRSPVHGRQIGDFVVAPRFGGRDRFEEYSDILDLLGSDISPEVFDSQPLVSGRNFRPPFYLEAVKFIKSLEKMTQNPWRRFDNLEKMKGDPSGQVNWKRYCSYESDPVSSLRFPVKFNILSENHREYNQLRFVFDLCKKELLSGTTPVRIKGAFRDRLVNLEKRLYFHKAEPTEGIAIRFSDPPSVKDCKQQANRVLGQQLADSTAWRVDFNDVFEKFVQHIFKEHARTVGGKVESNPRIRSRSSRYYSWELRQLEPDAVLRTEKFLAFIDAKYKSHLYNRFESSEALKEEYRRDIHQILAYTTFTNSPDKLGILCYPSTEICIKATQFRNPYDDKSNTILIIGIPLRRDVVPDTVGQIALHIDRFVRTQI